MPDRHATITKKEIDDLECQMRWARIQRERAAETAKDLLARLNAGAPVEESDEWDYPETIRDWAAHLGVA